MDLKPDFNRFLRLSITRKPIGFPLGEILIAIPFKAILDRPVAATTWPAKWNSGPRPAMTISYHGQHDVAGKGHGGVQDH